eukprot:gb/GECG01008214.1/.p1 GENE.gb/GECG01008214.1/~~gb/GECG01008214.1/.p1  ORF type:complete len:480 (+),score=77.92 gb/GECG01008214.1/:1-1440(+)
MTKKSRYVVHNSEMGTEDMSIPESLASVVVYDIALALKYCQSKGVVHRDVKPDNILLTSNGIAKLADFGVSFDRYGVDLETMTEQARLEIQESRNSRKQENGEEADEEDEEEAIQRATEAQLLRSLSHDGTGQETGDGSIEVTGTEGTFHFVSPEACSNSKYDGCAADMWALGCTLYAMVFGTLPFGADAEGPIELFDAIEQDSLPEWPKDVSDDLKDMLSQLLAKSPSERLTVDGVLSHPWLKQVQESARPELPPTDVNALQPYKSLSMVMMQQEQRRSTGASQSSAGQAGEENSSVGHNLDPSQQQPMNDDQQQFNAYQQPEQQPPGAYGYPSFASFDYGIGGDYPPEYQPWYMPIKEPFESPEMNEKWGHVIIRGWLYKRGRMRRSWRRRYIVLCMRRGPNGRMLPALIYFRNDQIESSENILGSMELQFMTSLGAAPKEEKPYRFFVSTHKRTMYLQALSEEARDMWLDSLRDLE